MKLAVAIIALSMQVVSAALWSNYDTEKAEKCSGSVGLKYLSGNALIDSPNCLGPNNSPYPR